MEILFVAHNVRTSLISNLSTRYLWYFTLSSWGETSARCLTAQWMALSVEDIVIETNDIGVNEGEIQVFEYLGKEETKLGNNTLVGSRAK
jgi:hypothetical protein